MATFLSGPACEAETPKNVVVMAKSLDDLITLDPAEAFEFSGTEIVANLYDRLFQANPQKPEEPIPDLVESWSISEDGLRYEFTLKEGRVFRDGRPLLSDDAVFSIKRAIILNKTPAFILSQLGLSEQNIDERVRVLSDLRFVFEVDKNYSPSLILNILSATITSVLDKQTVLQHSEEGDLGQKWLRANSAGSGPFQVSRWNVGEYVVLDSNPAHPNFSKRIGKIIIRDIREPATQRLMLIRKDIDIARDLTPDQIIALSDEAGVALWSRSQARIFYISLNQKNSILADPKVQKAIRFAIDYEGIVRHLLPGRAEVHQSFLPEGFLGSLNENPFSFDVAQARKLLDEAGHKKGFVVRVDVRSDTLALQVAQAIQTSLAQVGITLEIRPADGKQVLTRYRARRHVIYLGYWGPDYMDPHSNAAAFVRNLNNSDGANDRTLAWRNSWDIPQLSRLTDSATLIRDPFARAAAYAELQRIVQNDSPFIVLFQERALVAARDYLKGLEIGLTSDQIRYENIMK